MNCATCKHYIIHEKALFGFGLCVIEYAPWHWIGPRNRCQFQPTRWAEKCPA